MEKGYLLDESYGNRGPIKWIESTPEFSMLTGLKLRCRQNNRLAIYRRRQCHYLESYTSVDD